MMACMIAAYGMTVSAVYYVMSESLWYGTVPYAVSTQFLGAVDKRSGVHQVSSADAPLCRHARLSPALLH